MRTLKHILAGLVLAWAGSALTLAAPGRSVDSLPDLPETVILPSKSLHPHLDSVLGRLAEDWSANPERARREARQNHLVIEDDRVDVTFVIGEVDDVRRVMRTAIRAGGLVGAHRHRAFDARIPVARLAELSRVPGIAQVHRPIRLRSYAERAASSWQADHAALEVSPRAGAILSEGVVASNAPAWHAAGFTGAGVQIGIVDSFLDVVFAQIVGEVPGSNHLFILTPFDGSRVHGTASVEILYDMAPGARITMTSANLPLCAPCEGTPTPTVMAERIVALAELGHRVISSSIGSAFLGPGDGTGDAYGYADAIREAREDHGTLFVQAAGNSAETHWDGPYLNSLGGNLHEFQKGIRRLNLLNVDLEQSLIFRIPAGTFIPLYLRWNDWPASDQDYDLLLYRLNDATDEWELLTAANSVQSGSQPPVERIEIFAPTTSYYSIAIANVNADGTQELDVLSYGSFPFSVPVPERSLIDSAVAEHALVVGAVAVATDQLEPYSSRGPTRGLGGTTTGGSDQPRLVAYDQVSTWAFGPFGFAGTSSAAPHVAGAAALVFSAYPDWTPDQVQRLLEQRAVDAGAPGYDHEFGHGLLWLGAPPCIDARRRLRRGRHREVCGVGAAE